MEGNNIEFRKNLEKSLGDKMPKPEERKLSAITKRIILTQKEYDDLQVIYMFEGKENYNMWTAGKNKDADPSSNLIIPLDNYIETGDAQRFKDLFITENEARIEAEEAEKTKNQSDEHQTI